MSAPTTPECTRIATLAQHIVESLVNHTDDVQLNVLEGKETVVLEISVAYEDQGKILGKEGRHLAAIRTLLIAVGARMSGKRVTVEVMNQQKPKAVYAPSK